MPESFLSSKPLRSIFDFKTLISIFKLLSSLPQNDHRNFHIHRSRWTAGRRLRDPVSAGYLLRRLWVCPLPYFLGYCHFFCEWNQRRE